uniref:DYW domain-containing protein n=1 Tax=Oryza rufipogon TaxID=4529 RepID=A0A0E0Q2C9_ORYRU
MPPAPWPTPRTVRQAAELHAHLTTSGRLLHPPSAHHLLNSLVNCLPPSDPLHLRYALHLFDRMPASTFLFDTALRACFRAGTSSGDPDIPFVLFRRMRRAAIRPDGFTFHFLFKCSSSSRPRALLCTMLHAACLRSMLPSAAPFVANSLIHMYTELGLAGDVRRAFDEIPVKDAVSWTMVISGLAKMGMLSDARLLLAQAPVRDVISWTSLIAAYSRADRAKEAVDCFKNMLSEGIAPDDVTVIGVLSACSQLKDLELGCSLHLLVKEKGMSMSENLVVALIDMYAKCGDFGHAREVFDAVGRGRRPQSWNAIIDGYCKHGHVDVARSLFDQMEVRDIITFNSMITGYIHSGQLREALLLFMNMRRHDLRVDNFTVVSLLSACASLGALPQGRALHACIELRLVETDIYIGTALLDMYMKCGRVNEATIVFQRMGKRDVHAWTAMIAGLAFNGMGKAGLEYFYQMRCDGFQPNPVSYIAVLTACSHSCLLNEGRLYFDEMRILYNIHPQIEHYGCMIDLLGRSGLLDEAMDLVKTMPMQPNSVIWASILSACRVHKRIDLAQCAAEHLLKIEPDEDAVYVQLYNICIDSRKWEDASKIRMLMEERQVKKTAGYSSVTVAGQVHKFVVSDKSHPRILEIIAMLEEISHRLKSAGYSPITSQVTVDVDEEEKEQTLLAHSEKLAIAFGLVSLAPNLPVHIIKNLRPTIFRPLGADDGKQKQPDRRVVFLLPPSRRDAPVLVRPIPSSPAPFSLRSSVTMAVRDVASLNRMITGFIRDGLADRARAVYRWMVASGIRETPHTFSTILGVCSTYEALQLHGRVLALGLCCNPFVGSALVNHYMHVESPHAALSLFRELPLQNTAMCNVVLRGLGNLKLTEELICCFLDMRRQYLELNGLSYCYAMKGCYQNGEWLEQGRQLHGVVLKAGWIPSNIFLSNSLVDLYSAIGDSVDTVKALNDILSEDVISWNSILSMYADRGHMKEAVYYLKQMLWHGKMPSIRSFVSLLALSGKTGDWQLGVQIHGIVHKLGFSCSSVHVQTTLIDMYGKCCCFDHSLAIFNEIPSIALECCNSLITSSLRCNMFDAALEILHCMIVEGVTPDDVTFSATMKAISLSASPSLTSCQMLHSCLVKLGFEMDMAVCSSLITAYACAGQLSSSHLIFEGLLDPNVICFTAIISACARYGDGARAMELFDQMVSSGLKPDNVTFLCAIAGCDQAGMFEEGRLVIELMRASRELDPDERHFACMVNLLSRDGFVKEAMEMMEQSPLRHYTKAWSSLLQSCKAHGENVLGKRAANMLIDVGRKDPATTLQVSNFFNDIGDRETALRIKEMTNVKEVKKSGHSLIEDGRGKVQEGIRAGGVEKAPATCQERTSTRTLVDSCWVLLLNSLVLGLFAEDTVPLKFDLRAYSDSAILGLQCMQAHKVQNLIHCCLQLYMDKKEVVDALSREAKIEPSVTQHVWQKLEENNREFFKAYYLRLMLKNQITAFNKLLEDQLRIINKEYHPGPSSMPLPNGSNSNLLKQNPCFLSESTPMPAMPDDVMCNGNSSGIVDRTQSSDQLIYAGKDIQGLHSSMDASNLLPVQNANSVLFGVENGTTIKTESGYSSNGNFGFCGNAFLESCQSIGDASGGSFSSSELNGQPLDDSILDIESSSFGFLSQLPRNFFSDLPEDFSQSTEILDNYGKSPFLPSEQNNFSDSTGGEHTG